MRHLLSVCLLSAGLPFAAIAVAQDTAPSEVDNSRAIFDAEICKVDGLTAKQCDCAWSYLSRKLSPQDLKLAMLLTASNSEDSTMVKKADEALEKSNASDKRRDALSSETSSLVIEAEDSCQ